MSHSLPAELRIPRGIPAVLPNLETLDTNNLIIFENYFLYNHIQPFILDNNFNMFHRVRAENQRRNYNDQLLRSNALDEAHTRLSECGGLLQDLRFDNDRLARTIRNLRRFNRTLLLKIRDLKRALINWISFTDPADSDNSI